MSIGRVPEAAGVEAKPAHIEFIGVPTMRGSPDDRTRTAMTDTRTKFLLDEDRMPRHWYNIVADLPAPPPPPLHPQRAS